MASKAIEAIETNLRLCFSFLFCNMTLLFAKSYTNYALYELRFLAYNDADSSGCTSAYNAVHSNNVLQASRRCP